MKSKQDKGFTLVEVMVALFVVTIVSTPLLQMFVTTSYVNKDAQVMDMANVIAVQQAETFKADPEVVYNSENRYSYYKGDGTFIVSVKDELAVIPDGASIMVKSEFPDPTPTVTTSDADVGYYPSFTGTIDLSQYTTDLDVNITNTNGISVEPALSAFDSSRIKNNVIPIRVDFAEDSKTINVTNDSNLEAEFYVFNTNDGSGVILNTLRGASSIAFVPTASTSTNKEYNLTLSVSRLSKSIWVEMFKYLANKHIYN